MSELAQKQNRARIFVENVGRRTVRGVEETGYIFTLLALVESVCVV